jgi:carbon-monoxide dehydrogenase catalytic subunit
MPRKRRTNEERTADPAAQQMLIRAEELGLSTAFDRADDMVPCNIGGSGMCCKICGMGPCRLTKDGQTGVCGATIDTIQARNFIRAIAAGSAAHSDHGRDMAFTLKAVANREAEGYIIRDVAKLRNVASYYDIPIEDRSPEEIANDLADLYIAQFGQQKGKIILTKPPLKSARNCGKTRVSCRAAWTAKWSRRYTAPISATTRIPSTSSSMPCAVRFRMVGVAA